LPFEKKGAQSGMIDPPKVMTRAANPLLHRPVACGARW
jgi:hypothetical protein